MQAVSQNGWALQYAKEELKDDCEIVMKAVSNDGHALRHATQELNSNQEMMQAALEQSPQELVGLRVLLLSGKCCSAIFSLELEDTMDVLRRCAALLELDPDHVERRGVLMLGRMEMQDLRELEPGKLHELSLVLL